MYCKRSSKLSRSSVVFSCVGKILGLRCRRACFVLTKAGLTVLGLETGGHSGKSEIKMKYLVKSYKLHK